MTPTQTYYLADESNEISDTINTALKKLKVKLRVGKKDGMGEIEWYEDCLEVLDVAREHVRRNLFEMSRKR